jgi:hypothetical protein
VSVGLWGAEPDADDLRDMALQLERESQIFMADGQVAWARQRRSRAQWLRDRAQQLETPRPETPFPTLEAGSS